MKHDDPTKRATFGCSHLFSRMALSRPYPARVCPDPAPPGKAIALGVDISHATHLVLLTQAFYVTCGLALAVAACVLRQRPRGLLRGCSFARVSWTILALLLGSVPHAIGATRGERPSVHLAEKGQNRQLNAAIREAIFKNRADLLQYLSDSRTRLVLCTPAANDS